MKRKIERKHQVIIAAIGSVLFAAASIGVGWGLRPVDGASLAFIGIGCLPGSLCVNASRRITASSPRWSKNDSEIGPYLGYVAAIGYLQRSGGTEIGCTATHVGNGMMITAAHCMPGLKANDSCAMYQVRFGANVNLNCRKVTSSTQGHGVDVMRFELEDEARNIQSIRIAKSGDVPTDDLVLFGYLGSTMFSSGKCRSRKTEQALLHDCCTEPRASGAPILVRDALGIPSIVAIHSSEGTTTNWATPIIGMQ